MASITKVEDYQNLYKISTTKFTNLQWWIDKYERDYLISLLGKELYDLFYQDLTGDPLAPQSPIYEAIFDEIYLENDPCRISLMYCRDHVEEDFLESKGIPEMLRGFIYYEYVRHTKVSHTPAGSTKDRGENSDLADTTESRVYELFNQSVGYYKAIQQYIRENMSDYPTFKGRSKAYITYIL